MTDRNNWDRWMQKAGGKDMAQRANEQARKILNEHHPGVGHIAFERKD